MLAHTFVMSNPAGAVCIFGRLPMQGASRSGGRKLVIHPPEAGGAHHLHIVT
jgi:hypothetical protein